MKNLNLFYKIPVFSFLLLLSSCFSNEPVTPKAQHETKVWILEHNPQIEHPLVEKLFNLLVARLDIGYQNLGFTKPEISLYLIDNEKEGVFSLCDGSIFISTGTIKNLSSAHQMISMLAHDISHVYLKHACERTSDKDTLEKFEIEADRHAVKVLRATHIDPNELKRVYLNIYRKSEGSDARSAGLIDSARVKALDDILELGKDTPTKIPEERLFRKVKSLM